MAAPQNRHGTYRICSWLTEPSNETTGTPVNGGNDVLHSKPSQPRNSNRDFSPHPTKTYTPVSNEDLIGFVEHAFTSATGMVVDTQHYGLTAKDQRMFGVMRLVHPGDNEGRHSLAIGFRNSYDKSIPVGIAVGASVFVCDNMCFSGESFTVLRRHTRNVWQDLTALVHQAATSSLSQYDAIGRQIGQLSELELTDNQAYQLFGLAMGHKVLSANQVGAALRDWKNPRHPEFSRKDLWAWYNCANEALKTSPAEAMLERHTALHTMALAQLTGPVLRGEA